MKYGDQLNGWQGTGSSSSQLDAVVWGRHSSKNKNWLGSFKTTWKAVWERFV